MKNQQFALFICVFTILACIGISFPAETGSGSGSGSGSDDDLEEEAICWSVTSGHENNFTTNSTKAVLQARCTSACISQFETDGFYWLEDLMSDWQLYQNITSCVKGCIAKPQYSMACTDTCDTPTCSLGCDVYDTLTESKNDKAIPTAPKFAFVLAADITSPGIYLLNNSFWTDKGDSGSAINITATVVVIKVFVVDEVMNYYIVKEGFFDILSLEMFSCQAITVSYAFANQHGVSSYSTPTSLTVPGIIISQPVSVLISSLRTEFIYDDRHGFFGHYKMNLTWTNPTDLASIAYFELLMLSNQNHCESDVFTPINPSRNHDTSYLVQAEQPMNLPIAGCLYFVKIISVPLNNVLFRAVESAVGTILVRQYDPPSPMVTCAHYLDQNNLFTFVIELLISAYIVAENVLERISIIPRLVEYEDGSIVDQDAFPLIQRSVQANTSTISISLPGYEPKDSSDFVYEFSITLHWYEELPYQPAIKTYQCTISALSPKPDVIPHVELIEPVIYLSSTLVRIIIQWIPPDIKGEFNSYNVCLNREPVQYDEPSPQYSFCEAIYEENQTTFTWDAKFIPEKSLHCLYLQMSAQNKYLSGNWSKPLTIPLDDECEKPILRNISEITTIVPSVTTNIVSSTEITTIVPSVTTNIVPSTDTDPLLFVWIAVGVMLVAITTCIVLFVVITFHWKQKRRRIGQANCTKQTKEVCSVGGIPLRKM